MADSFGQDAGQSCDFCTYYREAKLEHFEDVVAALSVKLTELKSIFWKNFTCHTPT